MQGNNHTFYFDSDSSVIDATRSCIVVPSDRVGIETRRYIEAYRRTVKHTEIFHASLICPLVIDWRTDTDRESRFFMNKYNLTRDIMSLR